MRLVVLGGDLRHEAMAEQARVTGWTHIHIRPEGGGQQPPDPWPGVPWQPTAWVFPIPSCTWREGRWYVKGWAQPPAQDFFSRVRPEDFVLYSAPDEGMSAGIAAACAPARNENLLSRQDFLYKNAMLTVEGALRMAADATGKAFWRSNCLVVGYGRIGRMLRAVLHLMGARVWVSARKPGDLEDIARDGARPVETALLWQAAGSQDFVFNTVPAHVLDQRFIRSLSQDAYVLDLASAPFGADSEAMAEAGIRYSRAPGIPGAFYPRQAGEIILEELTAILAAQDGNHVPEMI